MPDDSEISIKLFDPSIVYGKRIALVGKLGGMNRKEFCKLLNQHGAELVDPTDHQVDIVVRGADSISRTIDKQLNELPVEPTKSYEETELWESLGLIDAESETGQLYTPAMLADLLNVPISTIRRWARRGLIRPARQFKRLAYFNFEEVASARRIARLIASGKSAAAIEAKLERIAARFSDLNSPLSQLSVILEGQDLLLRQGDGLIEPGGQKVFEFDEQTSLVPADDSSEQNFIAIGPTTNDTFEETDEDIEYLRTEFSEVDFSEIKAHRDNGNEFKLSGDGQSVRLVPQVDDADKLIELAIEFEDEGDLQSAIEVYRSLAIHCGPRADISFRLAELLYQHGDLSASRERYYSAIEQDPTFVEARASLGCVLVELGQKDLAVSAFRGALEQHPEYPDVHFHLAKLLEEVGDRENAVVHWGSFLELAPNSPWAQQARLALAEREHE